MISGGGEEKELLSWSIRCIIYMDFEIIMNYNGLMLQKV